jgi:AcrR family transcriptional regulator
MRHRDPNRIREIVRAASQVFLAKGYRQAKVADVARTMDIASGTIYLYFESKEALFDLVIRATIAPDVLDETWNFPIKTPADKSTFKFIKACLEREARFPALEKSPGPVSRVDPARELDAIVRELFRRTSQRWLALKLLERCAVDWPELAELWFSDHRLRLLRQLTQYLERRMAADRLRKAPDPAAAARLILELVAAFAMHCRADPYPGAVDMSVAEEAVVDAIIHAYAIPRKASPKKKES